MKRSVKRNWFPLCLFAVGILGLGLRIWLFTAGIDEKGLIRSDHPANYILPVLAAAVLATLYFHSKPLSCPSDYKLLFPSSAAAAIGNWTAGAGTLYFGISHFIVSKAYLLLLATAIIAVCFACLGYLRLKGFRPACLFHAVTTLFFTGFLLIQYSGWNTTPQLGRHLYEVFACLFLMFAFYYRAKLDAEMQDFRKYIFCNLAVLFFCCLSLTDQNRLFYLAMLLHSGLELCSLGFSQIATSEKNENDRST